MKREEMQGEEVREFEAPELTQIGSAGDVVQGLPAAGWDYRGWVAPEFEFQIDGDDA